MKKKDNQLVKFYKEKYHELSAVNDGLKNTNDKLLTDNDSLNNKLSNATDEKAELKEKLLILQNELKNTKSASNQINNSYLTSDKIEVGEYNSGAFFDCKFFQITVKLNIKKFK